MKVRINGIGMVDFPDDMSEEQVREALIKNFAPKKDDTIERLMQQMVNLLKTQQSAVITETKIEQIEKPVIVEKTNVVEVEKRVDVPQKPTGWKFYIVRDDDEISEIHAEPVDG